MSVVVANNLAKSFGSLAVLRDLSFSVAPGEIYGLVATNGTGKSTTMRILMGLVGADKGTARLDGRDPADDPEGVHERVGYMTQHFSLYGDLTVEENLRFFADMYGVSRRDREERLRSLYAFSRLEPFRKRLTGQLSGGMQKKLSLMAAMIHRPAALLLDEPTTGVDPISRRELWATLYAFAAQGMALVVSTPYFDEAERCHRVGLLHQGGLIADASPRALMDHHGEWIFERVGPEARVARDALTGAPDVLDVYLVGEALHIAAAPGTDMDARVRAVLGATGVEPGETRRMPPTFEDVFVARMRELNHAA